MCQGVLKIYHSSQGLKLINILLFRSDVQIRNNVRSINTRA